MGKHLGVLSFTTDLEVILGDGIARMDLARPPQLTHSMFSLVILHVLLPPMYLSDTPTTTTAKSVMIYTPALDPESIDQVDHVNKDADSDGPPVHGAWTPGDPTLKFQVCKAMLSSSGGKQRSKRHRAKQARFPVQ
jgi:hypothetical protein